MLCVVSHLILIYQYVFVPLAVPTCTLVIVNVQ